ncbi:MAG: hypothetical protein WA697_24015, partial [Pseudolabrys sp.]
QLIWLDCRDHFTGLRINHPDRRSGTLRPEELYTSKLNAAVASLRYSGVRLARVCTCAFSQKGVSVARLLLQDVTPGEI